jgi:hypothetical protein
MKKRPSSQWLTMALLLIYSMRYQSLKLRFSSFL